MFIPYRNFSGDCESSFRQLKAHYTIAKNNFRTIFVKIRASPWIRRPSYDDQHSFDAAWALVAELGGASGGLYEYIVCFPTRLMDDWAKPFRARSIKIDTISEILGTSMVSVEGVGDDSITTAVWDSGIKPFEKFSRVESVISSLG